MPHGVYQGYASGTRVGYAVRCDPVAAAYQVIRWLLEKRRREKGRDAGCRRTPVHRDKYRVRRDRYWYLREDDVFFHWISGDHLPRNHRGMTH